MKEKPNREADWIVTSNEGVGLNEYGLVESVEKESFKSVELIKSYDELKETVIDMKNRLLWWCIVVRIYHKLYEYMRILLQMIQNEDCKQKFKSRTMHWEEIEWSYE